MDSNGQKSEKIGESNVAERQRRNGRTPAAPMQTPPEVDADAIDLVELLYRLLGSWKLIVSLALLFALLAGVYTVYFVTPMYQATSTIYVLSRRDSAINMSDLQLGTALTSDYIKVFQMWEVHEEVISNLNLPYSYGQMRGMMSVSNPTGTRMLDITITSPNAVETATIANEYARVASQYIADTMSTDKPNILSVALTPANPVSPSKTRNVAMGFLLGGMLAVGYVTIRMLMDDKYKTADDIRRYTGLNTLAIVPVEGSLQSAKGKRKSGRKAKA